MSAQTDAWLTLARRCATIKRLREQNTQPEVTLVFDAHDQARVVVK